MKIVHSFYGETQVSFGGQNVSKDRLMFMSNRIPIERLNAWETIRPPKRICQHCKILFVINREDICLHI